jgi:hypothetical protein
MFILKDKFHAPEEGGEGGTGAGAGGAEGGTGGEGNANANQGGENNANDNLISHDTLWQSSESEGDAAGEGNAGNANQGQQQQPVDPNVAFQTHIDSLDFSGNIDLAAGLEAIRNGDTEVFGALLKQVSANAYRNAMVDTNKVVQQRVDKMGEQVQSTVSANQSTGELIREMGTQLPFTKSPAYAPVAKLVLTQFLQKGATPADAIMQVGKYFQSLSGEVGKINPGPPSGRPSGGFGGGQHNAGDGNASGETDWMQVLGGPAV